MTAGGGATPATPAGLKNFPYAKRAAGGNPDIFTQQQPTERQTREAIAAYYACVSFVDDNIGRGLAALDAELREQPVPAPDVAPAEVISRDFEIEVGAARSFAAMPGFLEAVAARVRKPGFQDDTRRLGIHPDRCHGPVRLQRPAEGRSG